jgi:hypothetical protein
MPYNVYEDPEVRGDDAGSAFPYTVKFEDFGDRVRGVVTEVDRWDPPPRKPGETPQPIIKYRLGECQLLQRGRRSDVDRCEVLAGAANLKGQMLQLQPLPGDIVDITFISDRPSKQGNKVKIFKVDVERVQALPEATAQPQPLRAVGGDQSGDDLF